MKLWVLWRAAMRSEGSWPGFDGLAEIDCAALDEEEARAIERAKCVAWARENPQLFRQLFRYSLEHELDKADAEVSALDDDEIMYLFKDDDARPFVLRQLDLDAALELDASTDADRRAALVGLAALLADVDAGAADALRGKVNG